jgi:NAD(P)-dependent dehydrogenase (short-subunit alcohol dehydrogenase family)
MNSSHQLSLTPKGLPRPFLIQLANRGQNRPAWSRRAVEQSRVTQDLPDILRLFCLRGRTAIVTGGSRGIGLAIANGLRSAGATVVAMARSSQPQEELHSDIEYISTDVTLGIRAALLGISERYRYIDVLVNAAGVSISAGRDFEEAQAHFDQTLKTNLSASYACCLAARPHMRAGSSIINVTSIGSFLGFPGNPGYIAAKGGLRMMTKALAVDYGALGIRVNALAPGYIHTDMTAKSYENFEENARRRRHTCLDRWGQVDDLVGAAIFLASDASAYVTGQDLIVDGGWTAKGMV